MGDTFDQGDMQRFMVDVFEPHLKRVDKHIEADDRRFEALNALVSRVSTSIEVGTAVQQAILSQSERITKSFWVKVMVASTILGPLAAIGIAIYTGRPQP